MPRRRSPGTRTAQKPTAARLLNRTSRQETQIRRRKTTEQRKDRWKIGALNTEPGRECGRVLLDRARRNPSPATVGIVGSSQLKRGIDGAVGCRRNAVEVSAQNRSSHDEMVGSPGM